MFDTSTSRDQLSNNKIFFNPCKVSTAPLKAAPERTFGVSWNEAADKKLSVQELLLLAPLG